LDITDTASDAQLENVSNVNHEQKSRSKQADHSKQQLVEEESETCGSPLALSMLSDHHTEHPAHLQSEIEPWLKTILTHEDHLALDTDNSSRPDDKSAFRVINSSDFEDEGVDVDTDNAIDVSDNVEVVLIGIGSWTEEQD
jgi:hypothetical protein